MITFTNEMISEGRDWLASLTFAEGDIDVDSLTPAEVIGAIARHYEGGITEFITLF